MSISEKAKQQMILKVTASDLDECVSLIRTSFKTVADEYKITPENVPRFTAFATDRNRIGWHYSHEHRPMYVYTENGKIIGYYSLAVTEDKTCELNNLCVHPDHRHKGIGEKLLYHSFDEAKKLGCTDMNIGIVEENRVLRSWYESHGFVHTGTKKFDFFPFTCGYMTIRLQ